MNKHEFFLCIQLSLTFEVDDLFCMVHHYICYMSCFQTLILDQMQRLF